MALTSLNCRAREATLEALYNIQLKTQHDMPRVEVYYIVCTRFAPHKIGSNGSIREL
jgi:hypothetical protein